MNQSRLTTRDLCLIGIFTAIISVMSQIIIPMPYGVPMTLQTFAIPLAGIILGTKNGTLSTLLYILLGAFGLPVFAGFRGGFGSIFGPTGGFILSFPIMALAAGIGADKNSVPKLAAGLAAGAAFNYLCGTLMFSLITSSDIKTAFVACVLPFIPTAVIKAVFAGVTGMKLKTALFKVRTLI